MKLLNMKFSPVSDPSSLVGPNIFLNIYIFYILGLCATFNVTDQVSHPYTTTGKITNPNIRILKFSFLGCKQEHKSF
jgi:hypothetical protein